MKITRQKFGIKKSTDLKEKISNPISVEFFQAIYLERIGV
jgi:hypothetical protein